MPETIAPQPEETEVPVWPDPPVDRTFGFLVREVGRLIKRRFERRARQTGLPLTRLQATVLLFISRHEGVSQAEVAARLDLEPIALVRLLDKLCEEELVERRPHPTDRRVRALWLTAAARPLLARILAINQAIREEAFAGLPAETRAHLVHALGRIKDNLAGEEAADTGGAPPPGAG